MNLRETMYQFKHQREVKHTTLNPKGPGVVRIHLIPPRISRIKAPSIVILNGEHSLPLKHAWAVMLSEFIDNINVYEGREISEDDFRSIKCKTMQEMRRIYPQTKKEVLNKDLERMFGTLLDVAYGRDPREEIPYMSMGQYARMMCAPPRMDIMVSSMEKDGYWHCNQKCTNCYAAGQHHANQKELSTEEWKVVIDKLRKAFVTQITFTGGEPTMRNDLVELVEHAKWFVTRLNTNGILLTEELCEQLAEASLDSVQVTLYSYDKVKHEELTGAHAFDKTVQGIKNALNAGLDLSINTPLCVTNKDYVQTLRFLHKLGVWNVSCSGIIYTGNARNEDAKKKQLKAEQLYDILKEAKAYCDANGMELSFTSPGLVPGDWLAELGINVPTCGACMANMCCDPSGNVMPCQSWLSENASLGNILTDPWSRIWNSPMAMAIRKESAKELAKCPLRADFGKEG